MNLITEDLETNKEYQTITAVKRDQIYGMLPYAFYHRNPSTILANAYYMGKVIYPEQFKDINPAQKADQIYNKFVGAEVYQELSNVYGGFKKLNLGSN